MPDRRQLHFDSLDDVRRESESLLKFGYERAGRWSLGTMGDHLGRAMLYSCEGFPTLWPRPIQWCLRRLTLNGILARETMRMRIPAPISVNWQATDQEGVDCLLKGIDCFQQHSCPMSPHILLGKMSREQWIQFHLWHCEHHFSFLLPAAAPSEDACISAAPPEVAPW